jgi:hypothetical protein
MSSNVLTADFFPFPNFLGISGGCMHRFAFRFAGLFLLVLFAGYAFSQGTQAGGITGIVKDTSGALISGANVTIVNDATGNQERAIITTGDGAFSANLLRPGDYTVTIKAQGFKTYTAKVPVRVNEVTRLDADLTVGATIDVVEVQANSTLVNTESATTGQPIDAATLRALPLPVPNFLFLLSLSTGTAGELADPRAANRGIVDINVNGQRTSNNAMTLEGINVNDFNLAHFDTVPLPNPNAIEEFKVATSLYDASSGSKGGGAVGLVFRSGSKDWHGSMYGNYRNDALNANEYFFNRNGAKRPKLEQSVFGASAGGPFPLLKGFWFANYQGLRAKNGLDPNGSSSVVNTPVFPTAADGTTSQALLASDSARSGISATTPVDPIALNVLNLKSSYYGGTYLVPRVGQAGCAISTAASASSFANLRCQISKVAALQDDQYVISYDRPFRDGKDKIGGRWFYDNGNVGKPLGTDTSLAFPRTDVQNNRFVSLTEMHQFSNRQINEFRFGFSRFISSLSPTDLINLSDIGAARPNSATVPGIYRIGITGAFSVGTGVNDERGTNSNTFYYGDTWSYTRGKHAIKAGGEAMRFQLNRYNKFAIRGALAFNNYKNFLKGTIDNLQAGFGDPQRYFRATDFSFFFQDDYRVANRLTLNLGLRWDSMNFAHDKFLRGEVYDPEILRANPNANPFLFPEDIKLAGVTPTNGIGSCGVLHCRDNNNFGPRVGFAWDLFGNQSTVLRGGYGIYFQRLSNQNLLQSSLAAPFFVQPLAQNPGTSLQNPLPGAPVSGLVATNFIPIASSFTGIDGNGDPNATCTVDAKGVLTCNNALFTNSAGQLCANYGGSATNCSINLASYSVVRPDAHAPYNQQWNLTVQRELFKGWAMEAGYVGAHYLGGLGIYNPYQARLASPSNPIVVKDASGKTYTITTNTQNNEALRMQVLGIDRRRGARIDGNIGYAIYHSGQFTLSHRFSKGLYFQSAYTYSHTIDNVSGSQSGDELNVTQNGQGGANVFGDAVDPNQNRNRGDFDRPHRLAISYTYQLPVPKSGIWGTQVFQGWNISGITIFQNGLPFSVTDPNGARAFGGGTSFGTLSCARSQAVTSGDIRSRLDAYFNASCFGFSPIAPNSALPTTLPAGVVLDQTNSAVPTIYGTAGLRNAWRGPFQQNWDFTIGKDTTLFERHTVSFRADFFNIFNHASFKQPSGTSIGTSTFGQITQTVNPARIIQFGLKYSF